MQIQASWNEVQYQTVVTQCVNTRPKVHLCLKNLNQGVQEVLHSHVPRSSTYNGKADGINPGVRQQMNGLKKFDTCTPWHTFGFMKKRLRSLVTTWMELKNNMPSKISEINAGTTCSNQYVASETFKLKEAESQYTD